MRRAYWSFYWPLAVSGVTIILVNQFHNGALARFPDAPREIANFAYAYGLYALSRASLVFVPQMANLLARSPRARRVTLVFIAGAGVVLTLPLLVLGYTEVGSAIVGSIFDLEGESLRDVLRYLRWFAPLVPVVALRQYTMGLLIQHRATRLVTALNLLRLATIFALLVAGFRLGLTSVATLVTAEWGASLLHLALQGIALVKVYRSPEPEHERLRFRDAFEFFWPVAVTSMMFAVSRPVLYAFVSRSAEADVAVAALRVAFDFALFFHQPLNQFRNLFATFGTDDLRGLRRFQTEVVLAMAGGMVLVSMTPLDTVLFARLLGVSGGVLAYAEEAFRVMCWLPLVVGLRNYFHGIALAELATRAMAYGAILRVGAITLVAWMLSGGSGLDHVGAALVLVLGFAVEACVVFVLVRRRQQEGDRQAQRPKSAV